MEPTHADVIVIGAGAAGLAAAGTLAEAGRAVLLLEARAEVGGRMRTRHAAGLTVPLELGAEFIHGEAQQTRGVLGRAGIASVDVHGQRWRLRAGRLEPARDWLQGITTAMQRAPVLAERDLSFDALLAEHLPGVDAEAKSAARRMAEGFDAADTARASARALVAEWSGDTLGNAPQSRPAGGYRALCEALLGPLRTADVRLRLRSVVRAVHWTPQAVTVRGERLGEPFAARAPCAIVTLPLGVLQHAGAGGVEFSPPLAAKGAALALLASGSIVKLLLRFTAPFWRDLAAGRYADAAFFHAPTADIPTFWTAAPEPAPLLVAWCGGPPAARLAARGEAAVLRAALSALGQLFGTRAAAAGRLAGYHLHDWEHDPCARGAYSYVLVGGGRARDLLGAPLAETLYFAGEATDPEEAGTVNGALRSGVRAAGEVLARRAR